jgi:acyl carrier protein
MPRERTEDDSKAGRPLHSGGRKDRSPGRTFLSKAPEPEGGTAVKATNCQMIRGKGGDPGEYRTGPVAEGANTPDDEAYVRDALKRCSASTREAAQEFRRTGNPACVPAFVDGLLEHYVDFDVRPKLATSDDRLRLVEDLDIDSLTMLEIVYLAEDVLRISLDNDEIRPFRTVGDVKAFLASKAEEVWAAGVGLRAARQ